MDYQMQAAVPPPLNISTSPVNNSISTTPRRPASPASRSLQQTNGSASLHASSQGNATHGLARICAASRVDRHLDSMHNCELTSQLYVQLYHEVTQGNPCCHCTL